MLHIFSGFFLLFLIGLPAPTLAAASPDTEETAHIRGVIQNNLMRFIGITGPKHLAMRRLVSRSNSGPRHVLRMVLGGYDIVRRLRTKTFRDPEEIGGRLAQKVFMIGPDGKASMVVYLMEKQDSKISRIGGISIIPLADQSA